MKMKKLVFIDVFLPCTTPPVVGNGILSKCTGL